MAAKKTTTKKKTAKSTSTASAARSTPPALPAWIRRDSVTVIVPFGITIIEMGPLRLGHSKPRLNSSKYGVQSPDDYGILPVRFNLGSAMDRKALLIGLLDGFSWRELHENPNKRIGWRFEEAFEEKADCGDFENTGKDCFELTESGWMEVDDPKIIDSLPDIDESNGTFATLTEGPFSWAKEIEFRSAKSRHLLKIGKPSRGCEANASASRSIAAALARRLGEPMPLARSLAARVKIAKAHEVPLSVEHPKGFR